MVLERHQEFTGFLIDSCFSKPYLVPKTVSWDLCTEKTQKDEESSSRPLKYFLPYFLITALEVYYDRLPLSEDAVTFRALGVINILETMNTFWTITP